MASVIFVEGKADKRFLEDYLTHLHIGVPLIIPFEGKDSWSLRQPQIITEFTKGNTLLFIFDADKDLRAARDNIKNSLIGMGITMNYHIFILPDDLTLGEIETLLVKISSAKFDGIYGCFDSYIDCISKLGYVTNIPDHKTKVFAYCSSMNEEPNETKRKYLKSPLFDLDHQFLAPLRQFLSVHLQT